MVTPTPRLRRSRLARYDHGALPNAIYGVVRAIEIEISEIQMRKARDEGCRPPRAGSLGHQVDA
ncbi:hypothetical protein DNX69_06530 [Rhodopseudomonas palustris]|uniref:Uncharacterized protein n=1 Tax=Rhodopseudomonas palustris TaxID=1076 RepID=A0A323UKA9_RHOPL|nr:hypothetical protein DNX69_06530 [Rhodopseudomonas palustris]